MHRALRSIFVVPLLIAVGAPSAMAQSAPPPPPPAPLPPPPPATTVVPLAPPPPPALPPPYAPPAPPAYVAPVPPPAPPPAEPKSAFELTTLKILHDKNVLSDKEYESALRDLNDTSGSKAGSSTSVVLGKWATTLYGFVEADSIVDTTQSLNDGAGNAQIARAGSYAGEHGRVTFGIRNSRLGFRMKAPEFAGIRVSAQIEVDWLGTQLPIGYGQPYFGTEQAFFTNPTMRARHVNLKVETPVVDFLFGQYWALFGWQPVYNPNTVEIQGVPGELFSRTPQVRISKTINTGPVTVEAAVAALRPPQRDSATPEGQAGLRLAVNDWTGVQTIGSTGTSIQPLSVAVTGDLRQVGVPEFIASPTHQESKTAGAVAVDGFVPVIPGSKDKMGNSLSLHGEYANGFGISDQYTGMTGGVSFALPNPNNLNPAPAYPQDIDNGIVTFDSSGQLHFIQWSSYLVGLQYYLPGTNGHVWVAGSYSHMHSDTTGTYFANSTKVRQNEDWFDVNLFADVTPAMRLGFEYANFNDQYQDNLHAINHRGQFSAFFIY
jgi:hypothetical protein